VNAIVVDRPAAAAVSVRFGGCQGLVRDSGSALLDRRWSRALSADENKNYPSSYDRGNRSNVTVTVNLMKGGF